jgi:hypothetical protein
MIIAGTYPTETECQAGLFRGAGHSRLFCAKNCNTKYEGLLVGCSTVHEVRAKGADDD